MSIPASGGPGEFNAASSISDPDGNSIGTDGTTITDTIGRSIPDPKGWQISNSTAGCPVLDAANQPLVGSYEWDVPGYNGGTQKILFCYATVNVHTDFWGHGGYSPILQQIPGSNAGRSGQPLQGVYYETIISQNAIQSIVFPDGSDYEFTYSSADPSVPCDSDGDVCSIGYGYITNIKLPTGGTISYTYGQERSTTPDSLNQYHNALYVDTRTVSDGNGNNYQWTYSNNPLTSTVVTDPNLNDTVHNFDTTGEISTVIYQGSKDSGTQLQSTSYQRDTGMLPAPYGYTSATLEPIGNAYSRITSQTLTTGSYTATTGFTYDTGLFTGAAPNCEYQSTSCTTQSPTPSEGTGLITNISLQDSSGYVSRSVSTQYKYRDTTNSGSAYLAANMLELPCIVVVSSAGGSPGTGCQSPSNSSSIASETVYGYDESNGSPQGVFGHQTSVSNWVTASQFLTSKMVYNTQGMPFQAVDPALNTTTTTFDATGLFPQQVQQPTVNGQTEITQYSYDSNTGLLNWYIRPGQSFKNFLGYDAMNRVTSRTDTSTRYSYPSPIEIDTTQDQTTLSDSKITSTAKYDGLGRLIENDLTSDPAGTDIVTAAYDGLDNLILKSNPHRATPSTLTDGFTTFSYDALGRMTVQCDADNGTGSGSCVAQSAYQSWSHSGNTVTFQDEALNKWLYTYDVLGRLVSVKEPDASNSPSIETDYAYDPQGDLIQVDQWGGAYGSSGDRQRRFIYDGLSRLTSATNPESGTTTYAFMNNGAVCAGDSSVPCSRTDARGVTTTYAYDALNRVTSKSYNDGATLPVSYTYDTRTPSVGGQTITMAYPTGRLVQSCVVMNAVCLAQNTFDYTSDGQIRYQFYVINPTLQTNVGSGKLVYPVNFLGDVEYTEDLSGHQASFAYDGAEHLTSVISNAPEDGNHPQKLFDASSAGAYGPSWLLNAKLGELSSGQAATVTMNTVYDNRMRVTSQTDTTSSGGYQYSIPSSGGYAKNGNILSLSDSVTGSWNYTYDNMNRITDAQGQSGSYAGGSAQGGLPVSGAHLVWYYDNFGNRGGQASLAGGYSSTYADYSSTAPYTNRMVDSNFSSAAGSIQYDGAGNVTFDGIYSYAFDGEGRLCAVGRQGVGFTAYLYNAEGMRIAKGTISQPVNNFVTTASCNFATNNFTLSNEYVRDKDGNQIFELNGSQQLLHTNVFVHGKLLASYDDSSTYFPLTDVVGTKRALVIPSGQMAQFANLPFGDEQSSPSSSVPDETEHHFTGKERDAESGLAYFGARFYDSNMGRFISPDPSGIAYANPTNPQSLNLYAYALNNPLAFVDPTGLTACFYGGQGDTPQNDRDASDYEDVPNQLSCTENGGVALADYQSVTVNGNSNGDSTNYTSVLSVPSSSTSAHSGPGQAPNNLATIARCASKTASSVSLAALLPSGTPSIVSNILDNDFSGISDLITGPGRVNAAAGILQGKALNTGIQAIGGIQYTADRFILGTNGAGTTYAIDMVAGTVANSAAGKLAGSLLGTASSIKLAYDAATYLGAAAVCYASQ